MSSHSAARVPHAAAPQRLRSTAAILELLRRLHADTVALQARGSPGLDPVLDWLRNRERRLRQAFELLQREPAAGPLIDDWLAHAPLLQADFRGLSDSAVVLRARVAALELHLLRLFAQLLQHSDSPWVRDLYRDLLDHRVAPGNSTDTPGGTPTPC